MPKKKRKTAEINYRKILEVNMVGKYYFPDLKIALPTLEMTCKKCKQATR
jgi:hypothetical protein